MRPSVTQKNLTETKKGVVKLICQDYVRPCHGLMNFIITNINETECRTEE